MNVVHLHVFDVWLGHVFKPEELLVLSLSIIRELVVGSSVSILARVDLHDLSSGLFKDFKAEVILLNCAVRLAVFRDK